MNIKRKKRVLITGMGIVSPIGIGVEEFWQNLLAGESGLDRITLFDTSGFPFNIAAEVKNFRPEKYLTPRQTKCFSRGTQFACVAAQLALDDARINGTLPRKTDVVIGSGVCSFNELERILANNPTALSVYKEGGINPLAMQKTFIFAPACAIAQSTGAEGYVTMVSSACSSGINAVGLGAQRIADGYASMALAGGAEAPITPFVLQGFYATKKMTREIENPREAVRPFDTRRSGTTLGEGSAIFLLEEASHARARKAKVYGEVLSFAQGTQNINEFFLSDKKGKLWARTMKKALRIEPKLKIDHVCAHGSGIVENDLMESAALHGALGKQASQIPVTSIKGAVGNGFAFGSAISVASGAMCLFSGHIPPTCNHEFPDPGCKLNVVKKPILNANPKHVMVDSFGIGAVSAAIVLKAA